MTADTQGNDLSQVPIPVGGLVAFAPYGTENVIPDGDMGNTPLALPTGYRLLGLVKQDGAPQHQREAGDAIEFWQPGYTLAGEGSRGVQVNLAENNDAVLQLVEGKTPNGDGVIYVDSSLPDARVLLFMATKFKDGSEDRYNGVAQVTSIEVDQDTRGEVRGRSVTLTWQEDELFDGAPFKLWHGAAAGTLVKPTVTAASPAEATAGAKVTLTGSGFRGATSVKFGATEATVINVVSDTTLEAAMPAGTSGSAAIVVVKGSVESDPFPYTRG